MVVSHHELDPADTKMEQSCRLVRPVCIYLKKEYGEEAFAEVAEAAGLPADYLLDEHNWMSHDFYKRILEELVRYTEDPRAPYKAGLYAATPEGYGHLYWLLRAFGSPEMIYKQVVRMVPKYTKVATYKIVELTSNKVVLELRHKEGYQQSELACLDAIGELASVATVQGSPPARAVEHQCQAHGAECCIYELRWINKPRGLPLFAGLGLGLLLVLADYLTVGQLFASGIWYLTALGCSIVVSMATLAGAFVEASRANRWNARLAKELDNSLMESMEAVEQKFEDLRRARDEIVALKNDELLSKARELEALNEELTHAYEDLKKTDSKKTEFLRIVAHDLKTPLASIHTYARMLTMYEDLAQEEQRGFVEIIEKESVRLASIIDRFLDLTRIESGTLRMSSDDVALRELLLHIGKVFQTIAEGRDNDIVFDIDPQLPRISADEGRLGQAVSNLLSNACKFSPAESRILVKARAIGRGGGTDVLVSITDSGPGISEQAREAIYQKFYCDEVENGRGITGQGLGLFIANEIVRGHGGRLYHESRPGGGTTFHIRLPVERVSHDDSFGD